jgi:hypothetical protein
MAYTTLNPATIKVGDPVTKDILDLIKSNFDDHETRINSFEAGSAKIPIFEFLLENSSVNPDLNGIAYYTAVQNFTITECAIKIFQKGVLSGFLEVDVKKTTTSSLADASFVSVFTTKPKINYATAVDYQKSTNQIFNAGQVVLAGETLRLDLSTLPTNGIIDKFLIICYGEI